MTTYTAIANGDIDQDSPVTQPLLTRMRDNPLAVGEGSTGAPKVQGQALGNVFLGMGQSVNGTDVEFTSGIERGKTILFFAHCATIGSASLIQVDMSDDNGSSWEGYETVVNIGGSGGLNYHITVDIESGAFEYVGDLSGSGTLTNVPSGTTNGVRIRLFDSGTGSEDMGVTALCLGGLA